jgi:hypothetical protein
MTLDASYRRLLDGLENTVREARALLEDTAPIPVPEPIPEAAPALLWGGGATAYRLARDGDGVRAETLVAHGVTGVVISGQGDWWHPEYEAGFPKMIAKGLDVYVGKYLGASPTPTNGAAVSEHLRQLEIVWGGGRAAGADGCAIDMEPYGAGNEGAWTRITAVDAAGFGREVGLLAVQLGFERLVLYASSEFSWPGSYNDLVLKQEYPGSDFYADNKARFFLQALCDTGLEVVHSDAVFHHGPQLSGHTWDEGAALSVELARQFHPALKGSIMFWPDIDEGHWAADPGYPPGWTREAAAAGVHKSTGPFTIYHGDLNDPRWTDLWLPEIQDGMASP